MNLLSKKDTKKKTILDIVIQALLGAVLFVAQIALRVLPNIELVSLLVIIFAMVFRYKSLVSIYIFVILEGLLYGFGVWWIMYLYVWTILAFIAILLKNVKSNIIWAIISGIYGLCFGALCTIPYFFIGGWSMALSWWIAGIYYDILHCAGNFVAALVLFNPVYKATSFLNDKYLVKGTLKI